MMMLGLGVFFGISFFLVLAYNKEFGLRSRGRA